MRFLMWRNLFVVCLVAAACVAVTMPAWNGHKTEAAPPQTAVSPAPEMVPPAPETIPVAASDLAAMGLGGPRDEAPPGVPCLQTLDGFVVYSWRCLSRACYS